MECTNCKAIVDDGEEFCSNCGASITTEIVCKKCKTINTSDSKFCENCGDLLSEEESVSNNEQSERISHDEERQRKNKKESVFSQNIKDKEKIEHIIKNNLSFKDSDFYFYDDIPQKKRSGAQQSYVTLKDNETIICLFDSTVFGGAKEGICLTNYGIYWKEIVEEGNSVLYSEIYTIEIKNKNLFINNLKVETCNCKEKLKKTLEEIVAFLGEN